jgi:hypothetical protein
LFLRLLTQNRRAIFALLFCSCAALRRLAPARQAL